MDTTSCMGSKSVISPDAILWLASSPPSRPFPEKSSSNSTREYLWAVARSHSLNLGCSQHDVHPEVLQNLIHFANKCRIIQFTAFYDVFAGHLQSSDPSLFWVIQGSDSALGGVPGRVGLHCPLQSRSDWFVKSRQDLLPAAFTDPDLGCSVGHRWLQNSPPFRVDHYSNIWRGFHEPSISSQW